MLTNTKSVPTYTLEQHLTECEERYQAVVDKLDVLDTRMSGIEQLLLEIKQAVNSQ